MSDGGPEACLACGHATFEVGFVDEVSMGNGKVRWVAGVFREGFFGGAKGRAAGGRPVVSYRCEACSRLELYAGPDDANPYGI